ncbi:ABC-type multidrug transport system, ATpase component [Clostridium aceticum]|uniref:ABC-type multidrug transport system, ATpase component n=1 Tax=Clostridium aceticum TaxID=84022 RepID=A0A0D8ID72_9CLOT|nr:ABC transporter ATP-binding protein [Clostridium aceticum]AKL95165.1 ABC-type multidrug transport system, ATpase component [Clostridium aceticum]KJF28039.1 ABC transporter [Clostridium aceticum]
MLTISNLSKTYLKTKKVALKDINLNIEKGEFTALLGQNGAGKTTLINILAGNVKKTHGEVKIGDHDLENSELETKKIIGIVPQEISYETAFTVEEILKKQAGYFGFKNNNAYIDELLESLALEDKKKAYGRELSGGMKRRLLIAKALIHKPEILILDEPTAGVDIELRHAMYEFLKKLHKSGMTIILTTHYIEEAEKLCKRVVVINKGEIIADEPKDKLLKDFSKEIKVEIDFDCELSINDFKFLSEYNVEIKDKKKLILKIVKNDLTKVIEKIVQKNMKFIDLNIEKQSLEDIYLQLIRR